MLFRPHGSCYAASSKSSVSYSVDQPTASPAHTVERFLAGAPKGDPSGHPRSNRGMGGVGEGACGQKLTPKRIRISSKLRHGVSEKKRGPWALFFRSVNLRIDNIFFGIQKKGQGEGGSEGGVSPARCAACLRSFRRSTRAESFLRRISQRGARSSSHLYSLGIMGKGGGL